LNGDAAAMSYRMNESTQARTIFGDIDHAGHKAMSEEQESTGVESVPASQPRCLIYPLFLPLFLLLFSGHLPRQQPTTSHLQRISKQVYQYDEHISHDANKLHHTAQSRP
jgi:hypothetical protein